MAILKVGRVAPTDSLNERECKLLDRKLQGPIRCWLCKSDLWSRAQLLEAAIKYSQLRLSSARYIELTGTPAGRNLSKLRTGIMKQSRSSVANEIGSLLELTKAPVADPFCWPLKLTECTRDIADWNEREREREKGRGREKKCQ
jgi:hypothetical protein